MVKAEGDMLAIAGSQEKWEVGLMRISGSVGHWHMGGEKERWQ